MCDSTKSSLPPRRRAAPRRPEEAARGIGRACSRVQWPWRAPATPKVWDGLPAEVVWPAFEPELFTVEPPDPELRRRLGIADDEAVLVYAGNAHRSNAAELRSLYLAVAALNRAGCGGLPGSAITVANGGTLAIVGDVVSNGAISNAGTIQVAGDTYARCQASVSGLVEDCYPSGNSAPCTYPDKLGVVRTGYTYADPNYAPPVVVGARFALEPGRGRAAVPVRPALLGAVAGVLGVLAAFTFSAGVSDAAANPARFGQTWQLGAFLACESK